MTSHIRFSHFSESGLRESDYIEQPFDVPDSPEYDGEPDDSSEVEDLELEVGDDSDWDVFIPDDDYDPEPERSDFEAGLEPGAWGENPE
jgi:hypothetical protein